jgi:hypothetical protein
MTVPFPRPVYVVGAAALSTFGAGLPGLAAGVAAGGGPRPFEAPALARQDEPCEPRHRKMMSRAAYLAAAVVRAALREPGVAALDVAPAEIGCFLGVGASGGDMGELEAMLAESVGEGAFDLDRFAGAGLRAANPLFAFQLMNNFTVCHAAILAGLGGPNAAFFSRGVGTVQALREAAFAVAECDAPLALAGGADSALHPVTRFELGGAAPKASEGAAVLALSARASEASRVRLRAAETIDGNGPHRLQAEVGGWPKGTFVVTSSDDRFAVDDALGETLAAGPALACAVALDWLAARPAGWARVLCREREGEAGVIELAKEPG